MTFYIFGRIDCILTQKLSKKRATSIEEEIIMKTKKSLKEKLNKEAQIVDIPPKMAKRFGEGKMLIPRPLDIAQLIKNVPSGKLITQRAIREKLAKESKVTVTCPITTGIFLRMIAEAAEEERREGHKVIEGKGKKPPKVVDFERYLVEL